MSRADLPARLHAHRPLLLDGATGTELERRGVRAGLPLWSTHALLEAPDVLARIHTEYAMAGAEVITACTFRTQARTLAHAARAGEAAALTKLAVALARGATERMEQTESGHRSWVAGSAPPLEDCYRPERVPADPTLAAEHDAHIENLRSAGVDLILVETMNCVREAVAAARAAADAGVPAIVSFVSWSDARLLSGEPLAEALDAVLAFEPIAVGVNCLPPSGVAACLPALRACGAPFGVYANLGPPADPEGATRTEEYGPVAFAERASEWVEAGARFVGGCCGTTPATSRRSRAGSVADVPNPDSLRQKWTQNVSLTGSELHPGCVSVAVRLGQM